MCEEDDLERDGNLDGMDLKQSRGFQKCNISALRQKDSWSGLFNVEGQGWGMIAISEGSLCTDRVGPHATLTNYQGIKGIYCTEKQNESNAQSCN